LTASTLKISSDERDTLHGLMLRRLLILAERTSELARAEGTTVEQVCERFGDDLRLMEDIGWAFETDGESVELTMPADRLAETVKRLRRDARRAPCEERHEREPEETDDERWQRFGRGVEVCEELLGRLDSPKRNEEDAAPIGTVSPEHAKTHELTPYVPVTDGFVLAAVERAELHEQEGEILTSVLMAHLGFEWAPPTNRLFFPRLDELRQVGLLTSTERRGEPFWSLTSVGREQLAGERETGAVGDLPESPQHRTWRHARVEAALRIEEFKDRVNQLWEETGNLLNRYHPANSAEWFELSERLHHATWRLGSATYCLNEWIEPADERPSVDEAPGPSPGRRAVFAWDQEPKQKSGGSA
jgi:hypothetical protein